MKTAFSAIALILVSSVSLAAAPSSTIECGPYPGFQSDYSVTFSSNAHREVTAHVENKVKGLTLVLKCATPDPCVDVPGQSSCGSRGLNDQQIYVCDDGIKNSELTKPLVELILSGTELSSQLWNFGLDTAQLICKTN